MAKLVLSFSIIFLLFFNGRSADDSFSDNALPKIIKAYEIAENAYSSKNYTLAAEYYGQVLDESVKKVSESTRFKYAVSLYRSSNFKKSSAVFTSLQNDSRNYLPQYVDFFKIKSLWPDDPPDAAIESEQFINTYKKTALSDSLILPLADYFYQSYQYSKARKYYELYMRWSPDKNKKPDTAIKSALSLYYTGQKSNAREEFKSILRKYPSREETLKMAIWLSENEPDLYKDQFFKIVEVYIQNDDYTEIKTQLEDYITREKNEKLKEKARFSLVRLYFEKGQYKTALYGFNNLLENLSNPNLEPSIRLYFARIYLNQGLKQKSIDAYVDYAERYPRRRISPEAVWKAAWISEELQDLNQAFQLYEMVRKRWPGSGLAKEAYFREGFTSFRLGNINYANNIFNEIRFKPWNDTHKNRAQYWVALCNEMQNDTLSAKRLRKELAQNLWDDYYTMKSYLLHKNEFDKSTDIIEQFKNSDKRLMYYATGFSSLLKYFEEAFEVKEVLGEKYAFAALEDIKLVAKSEEEWIALAEIYKKLQAYGKAFRTYDYINKKFYADKSYNEKSFLLKERFPYYYDAYVGKYAKQADIEPELVLALMKQESVFDFKAHSWANAFGLMQLIPATAKEMASLKKETFRENEQLFDPEFNIKLGTHYLRQLSRQFDNRKELMLAAYNAGAHRVKRWMKLPGSEQTDVFIENIEFEQTRDYVRKVMKNYWAYKLLQNNFNIESNDLLLGMLLNIKTNFYSYCSLFS